MCDNSNLSVVLPESRSRSASSGSRTRAGEDALAQDAVGEAVVGVAAQAAQTATDVTESAPRKGACAKPKQESKTARLLHALRVKIEKILAEKNF